jgi:multiple sugar transport system permease protein
MTSSVQSTTALLPAARTSSAQRGRRVRAFPRRLMTGVLFITYALPLYWLIATSLKSSTAIFARSASFIFRPTIAAYTQALHQGIGHAAFNTIVIAGGTSLCCLCVGLPSAYGLARSRSMLVPVSLGILVVLQMVPQTSTLIPLYRVLGRWGMLGGYGGLIVADTAMLLPLAIILLCPWFRRVPREIEEAAAVDGASALGTFFRVVLPVVRNGAATVAVVVFVAASGEFLYAISFLSDPGDYPLSAAVSQQIAVYGIDWSGLMAVSVLAAIPSIVVFLASQRALVRGISMGVLK